MILRVDHFLTMQRKQYLHAFQLVSHSLTIRIISNLIMCTTRKKQAELQTSWLIQNEVALPVQHSIDQD